ncbi:MAG: glycosyltransferase [Chloroflexota bacterium]
MSDTTRKRAAEVEAALRLGYALGLTAGRQAGPMLGLPGPATLPAARSGGRSAARGRRAPLAALISARDEERTIAGAVASAAGTPGVVRVVVIANGCRDQTAAEARRAGAEVIEYAEPVGHDVGRALGAAALPGHDLLLLDGDFAVPPAQLRRFATALRRGADLVLNDQNPVYAGKPRVGTVTLVRLLLNRLLGRPDLGVNSLLIVPAGISARAVFRIGPGALAVPPLAQAKAVLAGLRVGAVPGVDVLSGNRRRPGLNAGSDLTPLEMLIIGDHLEAIGHILKRRGPRGGYTDLNRSRALIDKVLSALSAQSSK